MEQAACSCHEAHASCERLAKLGVEPLMMSPPDFEKYFRDDVAGTVQLAKDVRRTPAN